MTVKELVEAIDLFDEELEVLVDSGKVGSVLGETIVVGIADVSLEFVGGDREAVIIHMFKEVRDGA